jgi:protoporphyrinogen/coproporphyrinogen III oxidase
MSAASPDRWSGDPGQTGPAGRPYDAVIVGGGLAGLTAAWELRDRRVVVLEAEGRVGGRIRSEPRDPYWANFGAHLFPAPTTYLGSLVSALGLATTPVTGTTTAIAWNDQIVTHERLETYPFRLALPLPARVSLIRAGLRIRAGLVDYARATTPAPGDTPDDVRRRALRFRNDLSFAAYLGSLHPDVASIIRAAVNRVAAEPEQVAAGAGLALFEFAGTLSASKGTSHHHNLVGGSSLLPQAIATALRDRVCTGARVLRVRSAGSGVEVVFERGRSHQQVTAATAIVATPAPITLDLVPNLPPAVAVAIGRIEYGTYVVGSILTRERSRMPWDDIYAMVTPKRSFNMFFNTASVLRGGGPRAAGGSLMVYGAGGFARALLGYSDDEIARLFRRDLLELFPEAEDVIEDIEVCRWTNGIAYSWPGRATIQSDLEQPTGAVILAGDYMAGFSDMDSAAASGQRAARIARRRLSEARS